MEVRGGNHAQHPLHRLGVVVNDRKTLVARGGSIVALDGIRDGALCVVVQVDEKVEKGVWNHLAKWLQENLPLDFETGRDRVRHGGAQYRVALKLGCFQLEYGR